ncbi:MAG: hypothetical protein GY757_57760 [bacterium]|nr:hypothetical protein [bacterium]
MVPVSFLLKIALTFIGNIAYNYSMKIKVLFLILFLFYACLLTGGANKSGRQKTLHFAISYDFDENYDPVERNYISLLPLFRSIYSTLFKLDDKLNPYPFLVENYKRVGKTVFLQLKKSALFSDGSPITSRDVVDSIEAGMKHNTFPNPVYNVIEGGEEFFRGKTANCTGIRVTGAKTLEIALKEENVEFAHYFASPIMAILPGHRNKNRDKMLFSGSFQVVKRERLKRELVITLKKNQWYPGKKSKIDTLSIHFYPKLSDCRKAVERGIPDLFLYLRSTTLPKSSYKYKYFKTPTLGAFYLKLNPKNGPFKDKRFRTFFKNFIRSQKFARPRFWHLTIPANLVLPHGLTGYFLFKEIVPGAFKHYISNKKVTVRCLNSPTGIRKELLSILKKKLKKYNVDLDLKWEAEMDKIHDQEQAGTIDLTSIYYLVDIPLSSYFYESLFIPGHELNLFRYTVPEALKLLSEYRKENNGLKRLKILSRLEMIAQDEALLIPVLNPLALLGYKEHLENVRIDKFLYISFEDIDVK